MSRPVGQLDDCLANLQLDPGSLETVPLAASAHVIRLGGLCRWGDCSLSQLAACFMSSSVTQLQVVAIAASHSCSAAFSSGPRLFWQVWCVSIPTPACCCPSLSHTSNCMAVLTCCRWVPSMLCCPRPWTTHLSARHRSWPTYGHHQHAPSELTSEEVRGWRSLSFSCVMLPLAAAARHTRSLLQHKQSLSCSCHERVCNPRQSIRLVTVLVPAGWLDVPKHARQGAYIVNCAISPEVSHNDW